MFHIVCLCIFKSSARFRQAFACSSFQSQREVVTCSLLLKINWDCLDYELYKGEDFVFVVVFGLSFSKFSSWNDFAFLDSMVD